MSVINSMLRDLDRRRAPLPAKTLAQPTFEQKHRAWPRSAFALCALIVVVMWSWSHRSQQTAAKPTDVPVIAASITETPAKTQIAESPIATAMPVVVESVTQSTPAAEPANIPPSVAETTDIKKTASALVSNKESQFAEPQAKKMSATEKSEEKIEAHAVAPVIKQERADPAALNDERYQLARAALAQNQPQRAYELLRDNPPPLASAVDYHAVLAAVEQQLGHYADAGLRYQQLLMLDQNQASWWLGFALSLEGEHRNSDALAAYRRAMMLNALPDAARQYVTARITALSTTTGQTVEAEH